MSEYVRQHPLMIVQQTIKVFIQLIWFIVLMLLSVSGLPGDQWIILAVLGAILLISLLSAIMSWYFFTYSLEGDRLQVKSGVIFKHERSIRRERVQSINVFTNVLQRPFRVSKLQVKTAGSGSEVEFSLQSVKREEAERIKRFLTCVPSAPSPHVYQNVYDDEPSEDIRTYKVENREMMLAGLTSGRFLILFSILLALYSQFQQFIPQAYVDALLHQLEATPVTLLLLIGAGALLISWMVSTIVYYIQYYDFNIVRKDDRILLTWGLWEEKRVDLPVERIQALVVRENPLRQALGLCAVQAELAGGAEKNDEVIKLLCPIMYSRKVESFLAEVIPEYKMPESMVDLPGRSRRRYHFRAVLCTLPVILLALYISSLYINVGYGALTLILVPLAMLLAEKRFRDAATQTTPSHLCLRYRFFSLMTVLIKRNHVQSVQLSANPFQRMSSLRSLTSFVLSSPSGVTFSVKDLDLKEADRIWRWYSRTSPPEQID